MGSGKLLWHSHKKNFPDTHKREGNKRQKPVKKAALQYIYAAGFLYMHTFQGICMSLGMYLNVQRLPDLVPKRDLIWPYLLHCESSPSPQ